MYLTAKKAFDMPHIQAVADEKKREQRAREFLQELGLWRLQRGEGYVQAYEQFQRTGKGIEVGQRVFESDWFRELQDARAREIASLEEKQRAGSLTPSENDRWVSLTKAYEGDKQVSANWKSLSDEYQKIKARENTGAMDEQELREKEAQLKQRMFEQLDKASPELREKLLAEIGANDPSFRRAYEDSLKARSASLVTASNQEIVSVAVTIDEAPDELEAAASMMNEARFASATKAQGFEDGIETRVNAQRDFTAVAANRGPVTSPASSVDAPDFTRTGKHLTSDLA